MAREQRWVRETLVPMMRSQRLDEASISRVVWWLNALDVIRSGWLRGFDIHHQNHRTVRRSS